MADADVNLTTRPKFSGDGEEEQVVVDAQAFLRNFDAWCVEKDIAAANKAAQLIRCFPAGSKALTWWLPVSDRPQVRGQAWDVVAQVFRRRFIGTESASQLVKARDGLAMKQTEKVMDFFDRCEAVQARFDDAFSTKLANIAGLTQEQRRLIVDAQHDTSATVNFIAGLKTSVKKVVTAQGPADADEALLAATRAENADKDTAAKKPTVLVADFSGVEDQETQRKEMGQITKQRDDLNAQLNAMAGPQGRGWRGRGGRGRGGRRYQGNQGGQGGQGGQRGQRFNFRGFRGGGRQAPAGGRPSWLRGSDLPIGTCWQCGQLNAQHIAASCNTPPHLYQWQQRVQEQGAARQVQAADMGAPDMQALEQHCTNMGVDF